jgi:hypothetical protein
MEGNDIEDQGGGQFRTVDAVKRYSRLDQYMMGLIPPSQVPTFFYVESPNSSKAARRRAADQQSFTGTRRDVLIDDVIAVNGARSPPRPTRRRTRSARRSSTWSATAARRTRDRSPSWIASARSGKRSSAPPPRGA